MTSPSGGHLSPISQDGGQGLFLPGGGSPSGTPMAESSPTRDASRDAMVRSGFSATAVRSGSRIVQQKLIGLGWDDDEGPPPESWDPEQLGELSLLHSPFSAADADTSDCGVMFDVRARGALLLVAVRVGTELNGQGRVTVYTCDGPYETCVGKGREAWTKISEPAHLPVLQERRIQFVTPVKMRAGSVRGILIHGDADGAVGFRLEPVIFRDDFVLIQPGDYLTRGGIQVKPEGIRRNCSMCGTLDYVLRGCAVDGCDERMKEGRWMQYCGRHAGIPIGAIAGAIGVVATLPWRWTAAFHWSAQEAGRLLRPPLEEEEEGEDSRLPHPLRNRLLANLTTPPMDRPGVRSLRVKKVGTGPEDSDGLDMVRWMATLPQEWEKAGLPKTTGLSIDPRDIVCAGPPPPECPNLACEADVASVAFANVEPPAEVVLTKLASSLQYTVDGIEPRPPAKALQWIPPRIMRFVDIRRHAKLPPTEAHELLAAVRSMCAFTGVTHNITDDVIHEAVRTAGVYYALEQHPGRAQESPDDAWGLEGGGVHRCCMQHDVIRVWVDTQLRVLTEHDGEWVQRIQQIPPESAADGIACVRLYCSERLSVKGIPAELQLCEVMSKAMETVASLPPNRPVPVRLVDTVERARIVLNVFKPLGRHLDHFLDTIKDHTVNLAVRGTPGAMGTLYNIGDRFTWTYPAPAQTRRAAAAEAARLSMFGTIFVVQGEGFSRMEHYTVAGPDQDEIVIPEGSQFVVKFRLPKRLQILLGTRSDVVGATHVSLQPTPQLNVDLVLRAARCTRFLYDRFLRRYVEPLVSETGEEVPEDAKELEMGESFDKFLASETQRLFLLCGSYATGRSSLALSVGARLAGSGSPDSYTPIFINIPSVGRALLDPTLKVSQECAHLGAFPLAILRALHLDETDLPELRTRKLCIFLDAVDEAHYGSGPNVPVKYLHRQTLLERGGIDVEDWPLTKWVVTVHGEFLSLQQLRASHFLSPSSVKYIRFVPLQVRYPKLSLGSVHLGCIQIFTKMVQLRSGGLMLKEGKAGRAGERVAPTPDWTGEEHALKFKSAFCTDWCPKGEEAIHVGKVNEKRWRALHCPLVCELENRSFVHYYRLQSASEPVELDVVSWEVEGSDYTDGPWKMLHSMPKPETGSLFLPHERWSFTDIMPLRFCQYTSIRADVHGFEGARRDELVERTIQGEVEALAERIQGGSDLATACMHMRCHVPPQEMLEAIQNAQTSVELEEACRRSREFAVQKSLYLVRQIEPHAPQLMSSAFALHMLVYVTEELTERWGDNAEYLKVARWEVYQEWMNKVIHLRLYGCAEARAVIRDMRRLHAEATDTLMRVAVRSFTSPRPQITVGACMEWLMGDAEDEIFGTSTTEDKFHRALLSCLPLVCEDWNDDDAVVTFRHMSIRDQQVAAALSSVETAVEVWHEALSERLLDEAPMTIEFWLERIRSGLAEGEGQDKGGQAQGVVGLLEALGTAGGEASLIGEDAYSSQRVRLVNAHRLITAAQQLAAEMAAKPIPAWSVRTQPGSEMPSSRVFSQYSLHGFGDASNEKSPLDKSTVASPLSFNSPASPGGPSPGMSVSRRPKEAGNEPKSALSAKRLTNAAQRSAPVARVEDPAQSRSSPPVISPRNKSRPVSPTTVETSSPGTSKTGQKRPKGGSRPTSPASPPGPLLVLKTDTNLGASVRSTPSLPPVSPISPKSPGSEDAPAWLKVERD
eukprot:Hpha_TRINITY_DN16162_c1_g10::TRINITY_DN16162_c1_g10_i1::g.9080::m.9080